MQRMWRPYLNVIAEKLAKAVHVLDRFHVMQQFGKALDEVRAEEAKRLVRDGYEPVLKKSRWCFLKRPENLTDKQTVKLSEILKYNLRTVRAYLLREEFQRLWEYKSGVVGRQVPGRVDGSSNAFTAGADEEDRPKRSETSNVDPELVPCSRTGVGGCGRGSQQQSETGNEKVVRFSDRRGRKTGSLTQSRSTSRAKTNPQILLRSSNRDWLGLRLCSLCLVIASGSKA